MKVCGDCGKPKRNTEFYNNRDICKTCLFKLAKNARGKKSVKDGETSIGSRNPFARLAAAIIGQACKDAQGKSKKAHDARVWFFSDEAELYAHGSDTSITHMQNWAKEQGRK